MKNKYKFLVLNIVFIFLFFLVIELSIWGYDNYSLKKQGFFNEKVKYIKFHSGIKTYKNEIEKFAKYDEHWGRRPVGLEYNKPPIVIFGCSYAHGFNLNPKQIFSYKLSEQLKQPVYNQAFIGWGIQHMLFQTKIPELYERIKEPEYVIYVYISDHLRRLYLMSFGPWNILNEEFNIRYKEKDGKLIEIMNANPFLNQIKRLYFVNTLQNKLATKYAYGEKNYSAVCNFALKHFIESKNEMQKHWKNTKYIVFFYNDKYIATQFKADLEKAGFIIMTTDELTNENLDTEKYMQPSLHPTEAAWDLLTPKFIEKLKTL